MYVGIPARRFTHIYVQTSTCPRMRTVCRSWRVTESNEKHTSGYSVCVCVFRVAIAVLLHVKEGFVWLCRLWSCLRTIEKNVWRARTVRYTLAVARLSTTEMPLWLSANQPNTGELGWHGQCVSYRYAITFHSLIVFKYIHGIFPYFSTNSFSDRRQP